MPIRTASLSHQLQKNGARLHLAMASRAHSQGPDQSPSEHEQALLEERRVLKEAAARRKAQPKPAKPKAAWQMKAATPAKAAKAPKLPKEPKEPKQAKAAKAGKPSRAEKLSKKAENLEAAKKATKKSAKT